MLVIPVLDLMAEQVVHARRGDRAAYRPLRSRLTPSSEPLEVVRALLAVARFPIIYIADLDAIQRRGDHRPVISAIEHEFPGLELWLDAGFSTTAELASFAGGHKVPVIGSESIDTLALFAAMREVAPNAILSLDTRGDQRLGPARLFDEPALWPDRVIVMTLDRVGAGEGPSLEHLRHTLACASGRRVIAAGGVRHAHDLEQLEAMGVHAVLAASAIHDGALDRAVLARAVSC
jgi:phosphoribosylformimino-5-aminoimidazole carboxamide ribotide isomerase